MINENESNKTKDEKQLNHKKKLFIPNNSLKIKCIFREIRTLSTIYQKSEYLIQLKDLQLIKEDNKLFVDFTFWDEGINLYSLINSNIFDYRKQKLLIKWILFQILKGIETLHSLNIIHRDLNPYHILISTKGEIKITGFGNSINDIESKFVEDKIIGDLSHIAPECLVGLNYNNKIDIWAIGVLMVELYKKECPFFISKEDDEQKSYHQRFFNQLQLISNYLGVPFNYKYIQNKNLKDELSFWLSNTKLDSGIFNQKFSNIPDLDDSALELLRGLLAIDPKKRITCKEALKMDYFKEFKVFNKEEYKKNKQKNDNYSIFLKNLEKEFQKYDQLPSDKKTEIFKNEINHICQENIIKNTINYK